MRVLGSHGPLVVGERLRVGFGEDDHAVSAQNAGALAEEEGIVPDTHVDRATMDNVEIAVGIWQLLAIKIEKFKRAVWWNNSWLNWSEVDTNDTGLREFFCDFDTPQAGASAAIHNTFVLFFCRRQHVFDVADVVRVEHELEHSVFLVQSLDLTRVGRQRVCHVHGIELSTSHISEERLFTIRRYGGRGGQ